MSQLPDPIQNNDINCFVCSLHIFSTDIKNLIIYMFENHYFGLLQLRFLSYLSLSQLIERTGSGKDTLDPRGRSLRIENTIQECSAFF